MPFQSKAQQRFMFAEHPEMAKTWAAHTHDIKSLPERKRKEKKAQDGIFGQMEGLLPPGNPPNPDAPRGISPEALTRLSSLMGVAPWLPAIAGGVVGAPIGAATGHGVGRGALVGAAAGTGIPIGGILGASALGGLTGAITGSPGLASLGTGVGGLAGAGTGAVLGGKMMNALLNSSEDEKRKKEKHASMTLAEKAAELHVLQASLPKTDCVREAFPWLAAELQRKVAAAMESNIKQADPEMLHHPMHTSYGSARHGPGILTEDNVPGNTARVPHLDTSYLNAASSRPGPTSPGMAGSAKPGTSMSPFDVARLVGSGPVGLMGGPGAAAGSMATSQEALRPPDQADPSWLQQNWPWLAAPAAGAALGLPFGGLRGAGVGAGAGLGALGGYHLGNHLASHFGADPRGQLLGGLAGAALGGYGAYRGMDALLPRGRRRRPYEDEDY